MCPGKVSTSSTNCVARVCAAVPAHAATKRDAEAPVSALVRAHNEFSAHVSVESGPVEVVKCRVELAGHRRHRGDPIGLAV